VVKQRMGTNEEGSSKGVKRMEEDQYRQKYLSRSEGEGKNREGKGWRIGIQKIFWGICNQESDSP
jgi:hypothetical protein